MPIWEERDLFVDGVRLRCYRTGAGRRPLVLAHGFTDNARYWERLVDRLAPDWDVILYDARGHGRSDRAGGRFGDTERVGDLLAVVDALTLARPALIGHSMGAATVALAAAQRPDLARCLVLEDPAWYAPPDGEPALAALARLQQRGGELLAWREWVRQLQAASEAEALALVRAASPQWDEADARRSCDARRQFEVALFEQYPLERAVWQPVVARLACPVLLLTGEPERGGLIRADMARAIQAAGRQVRWTPMVGAGHSLRFDQFERYTAAVQAFLSAAP